MRAALNNPSFSSASGKSSSEDQSYYKEELKDQVYGLNDARSMYFTGKNLLVLKAKARAITSKSQIPPQVKEDQLAVAAQESPTKSPPGALAQANALNKLE